MERGALSTGSCRQNPKGGEAEPSGKTGTIQGTEAAKKGLTAGSPAGGCWDLQGQGVAAAPALLSLLSCPFPGPAATLWEWEDEEITEGDFGMPGGHQQQGVLSQCSLSRCGSSCQGGASVGSGWGTSPALGSSLG